MSRRRLVAFAALAVLGVAAPDAVAELRRVESIGAIPLWPGARRSTPPRDAAVRQALTDAVFDVARSLAPEIGSAEAEEVLPPALGGDPFLYTSRFRITEDRGEVPAEITADSGAPTEYVVVVDASVDADRVEDRLREAGLLFVRAGESEQRVTVVVEQLSDYGAYQKLLEALTDRARARAAVPVSFERGRAEIDVTTSSTPSRLVEKLVRDAPPGLSVDSLGIDGDRVRLRIAYDPPPEPDPATGTAPRNRRN